jgi:hypothetical protein
MQPVQNQTLAKCKFRKFFILIFIQNGGGAPLEYISLAVAGQQVARIL